jgi:hypothetical protein
MDSEKTTVCKKGPRRAPASLLMPVIKGKVFRTTIADTAIAKATGLRLA